MSEITINTVTTTSGFVIFIFQFGEGFFLKDLPHYAKKYAQLGVHRELDPAKAYSFSSENLAHLFMEKFNKTYSGEKITEYMVLEEKDFFLPVFYSMESSENIIRTVGKRYTWPLNSHSTVYFPSISKMAEYFCEIDKRKIDFLSERLDTIRSRYENNMHYIDEIQS